MREIKVTFKTLTPLWTGDAWRENIDVRPSSIMGALRSLFEIYCNSQGKLNNDSVPSDTVEDYVSSYNKQTTFHDLLMDKITNADTYEDALKVVFKDIKLPLPSIIFGCTGWKSQITVKKIEKSKYALSKKDINFSAILDKIGKNSEFWANKILFNDKDKVILFNDVYVNFGVSSIVYDEFVNFLQFYSDKIVVIGGKKSFGLGFCKMEVNPQPNNSHPNTSSDDKYEFKEIDASKFYDNRDKIVLGFNFKYYQRLKERRKFREKNFGRMSKTSNFFFSAKLKGKDKIYLVGFNDYGDKELFKGLLKKYSNFG